MHWLQRNGEAKGARLPAWLVRACSLVHTNSTCWGASHDLSARAQATVHQDHHEATRGCRGGSHKALTLIALGRTRQIAAQPIQYSFACKL